MEIYLIPKRLDEPERFAFWTVDEAAVIFVPAIVGMMMGAMLSGLVIAFISYMALRKFKGNGQANLARFAIYWFFPNLFNFKATPPSSIRRYI